jgi:hypothetical protein
VKKSALKTGIKAAVAIILLTICFFITTMFFPSGQYTTVAEFIKAYRPALLVPSVPAFFLALVNIPFFVSLYFFSDESKKPVALIGLLFGLCYTLCCSINYFMQLTVVPLNVQLKQEGLLSVCCMFIPGSLAYMLDNLGYAFLSVSFLLFSFVFNLKGIQGYIKSLYIIYSTSGLTGTIGYVAINPLLESFLIISALPYLIAVILTLIEYIRFYKNSELLLT